MDVNSVLGSVGLFVAAGALEIGGGYLVWLWLREGRSLAVGALGGVLLVAYGVIPTLQPASFGRVYAAYGGVFIVLPLIWGWAADQSPPTGSICWERVFAWWVSRSSCTPLVRAL